MYEPIMKAKKTSHKFRDTHGNIIIPDKQAFDMKGADICTFGLDFVDLRYNIWAGARPRAYNEEIVRDSDLYKVIW